MEVSEQIAQQRRELHQSMNTPKPHENPSSPSAGASGSALFSCPFCGYVPRPASRMGFPVAVLCPMCGATGPEAITGPEADKAWNDAKCRQEIRKLEETIDRLNQNWIEDNV